MRSLKFVVLSSSPKSQFASTGRYCDAWQWQGSGEDIRSAQDISQALLKLGVTAAFLAVDDDIDSSIRATGADVCMLALHGNSGGMGHIQAFLEMRGVRYVGCRPQQAALAYDKLYSRQLFSFHNLPVPHTLALQSDRRFEKNAANLMGWPCVLKPRRSSLQCGQQILRTPEEIAQILHHHENLGQDFLVERMIPGVEVQVVLMENQVLGAMQIERDCEFSSTDVLMTCPPKLSRGRMDGIYNLARTAARSLGLGEAPTRVDILLDSRKNEVVLEVEPLPPLHRQSVVALIAQSVGISYEELMLKMIRKTLLDVSPRPTIEHRLELQ